MIYSVLISIALGMAGLFIAYFWDMPTGAVIIFLLTSVYLAVRVIVWINNRFRSSNMKDGEAIA